MAAKFPAKVFLKDVPGVKVPRESAQQCNVTELKRWLLCRGAKTSGRKGELVKSFVRNIRL